MKYLSILLLIFSAPDFFGQNVGINATGAAPNASAMLDVSSTSSGMLIPSMTDVQRLAIASPATGLLVFQTNLQSGFWYYDGTQWVSLCSNGIYNNMYQVNGTAGVVLTVNGTWVALPGLSQAITLTGPAKVYVHYDGGLQTTSGVTTGYSIADFAIFVNGALPPGGGGYKRVAALNNGGLVTNIANCAMDYVTTLPAGAYTITTQANKNGGSNCNASGSNTSVLQGNMSIIVVYQ
jgi:hypothetical protein